MHVLSMSVFALKIGLVCVSLNRCNFQGILEEALSGVWKCKSLQKQPVCGETNCLIVSHHELKNINETNCLIREWASYKAHTSSTL